MARKKKLETQEAVIEGNDVAAEEAVIESEEIESKLNKKSKKETSEEMPKQIQGIDRLRKLLEENKKITEYLFKKFKKVLSQANEA
jgi:hypothetical protein